MNDSQLDRVVDQLILHWRDDASTPGDPRLPTLQILAERVARALPAAMAERVEAAPEANRQVIALTLGRLEQRDPTTRELVRSLAQAAVQPAVEPSDLPSAFEPVSPPARGIVFQQQSGIQVAGDYLTGQAVKAGGDYVAGSSYRVTGNLVAGNKVGGDLVTGDKIGGNSFAGASFGNGNTLSIGGTASGSALAGTAPHETAAAPVPATGSLAQPAPSTASASPAAAPAGTITILFAGANPADGARLRLDEEVRDIDAALRRGALRDRFELKQVWAVRMLDLQAALLQHRPQILHFSGHGSAANAIYLEDDSGHSLAVSGPLLARLLSPFSSRLRCVVLNACYSEGQAQGIAQHIECVIGMAVAVGDDTAIRFAAAFYQALAYGTDLQTAFDLGCVHVQPASPSEENTPRLIALRSRPGDVVLTAPG